MCVLSESSDSERFFKSSLFGPTSAGGFEPSVSETGLLGLKYA